MIYSRFEIILPPDCLRYYLWCSADKQRMLAIVRTSFEHSCVLWFLHPLTRTSNFVSRGRQQSPLTSCNAGNRRRFDALSEATPTQKQLKGKKSWKKIQRIATTQEFYLSCVRVFCLWKSLVQKSVKASKMELSPDLSQFILYLSSQQPPDRNISPPPCRVIVSTDARRVSLMIGKSHLKVYW